MNKIFVIYTTHGKTSVLAEYSTSEWKNNEKRYKAFYERMYVTDSNKIDYILANTEEDALEKAK